MSDAAFRKAKKYDWTEVVIELENSYDEFA
jgi:hypothetical protein